MKSNKELKSTLNPVFVYNTFSLEFFVFKTPFFTPFVGLEIQTEFGRKIKLTLPNKQRIMPVQAG